jgi:hypothetical protein
VITTAGFRAPTSGEPVIDLRGEERARHLDLFLGPVTPEHLIAVRSHIVNDLLGLHDRGVTYSLLATTALAVLWPAVEDFAQKFALWLVGITGTGKTFAASLFRRFFGQFPENEGSVSWISTPNYIERQGFYFENALYLVDDFKAGVSRHDQVVRILQAYADGSSRGRLRADASTNKSRHIRGQLVCTGEDVPEHTSSAISRSFIESFVSGRQDTERGLRCLELSPAYSAVTAHFICWLLQGQQIDGMSGRMRFFRDRTMAFRQQYLARVRGRQNDLRLATNAACMAAAFEAFAYYLADDWSSHLAEIDWYTN